MEKITTMTDTEILDYIYRSYGSYMYAIIRSMIVSAHLPEDDIQDCLSFCIMKISDNNCRKVRQFKGESSFKTYLTVVCRNLATDYIRSEIRKNKMTAPIGDIDMIPRGRMDAASRNFTADNAESQFIKLERESIITEAAAIVRREIDKLEEVERLVFKLRIEDGKTYREIDSFLDIDNSTYMFSRAIQKIRHTVDSQLRVAIEDALAET